MANKELTYIPIKKLALDMENPRLPSSLQKKEKKVIEYLANSSIEELMESIGINGFFDGESIIVYLDNDKKKYIVLEGNRRLTATHLLLNPQLVNRKRITDIANSANHKPTEIPTIIVENRSKILHYLGFRHIAGVRQWEPIAKARYLELLFNAHPQTQNKSTIYKEIARKIGSKKDSVKRNLDALAAFKIIEEKEFYSMGIDDDDFKFSVFYTALANPIISDYIGIKDEHPIFSSSCIDEKNLEQLTRWLFEVDEHGESQVGDSRNIKKLAKVIDNTRALKSFKDGTSLDAAYRLTSGGQSEFDELMVNIELNLEQGFKMIGNIDLTNDMTKRHVESVFKKVQTILAAFGKAE